MNQNLKLFKVIPSVVLADTEAEITIKSIDGTFKFFDDITYKVQFIPQDISDVPIDKEFSLTGYNKERKTFFVNPENGALKLKYLFSNEQEWKIHISTDEYAKHQNPLYEKNLSHWSDLVESYQKGITLSIYSLYEDLYSKRVMRGDLHIHTSESDGKESPEMVASYYRKDGLDFIAITDHHLFNTSKQAKEKLSFIENFKILHGEEVHNDYGGYFHMINIGGNYSVNDLYLNHKEKVEKEVTDLEKVTDIPEGLCKREYLHRVWMYNEIKKSGGYAIFPHPYWNIGFYHTATNMNNAIIKNGLCDAYEVLGGCEDKIDLQVSLYNNLRAEGYDIPIVGSTDSHSVLEDGKHTEYSTIVFADNDNDESIINAISDKYSVAVEKLKDAPPKVCGSFRLAMYTHFLLQNYFPIHDELCNVSGTLMYYYVHGEEELKDDIIKIEHRLNKYNKDFFGK